MLRKVLLVDDEPDVRRIAEIALGRIGGFEVALGASGAEALALAERERPDAILLDVTMPGMDGPATLAALRARHATAAIPVVFLTARVQRHEVEAWLRLGARGVIRKPFDPIELPARLLDLVGG